MRSVARIPIGWSGVAATLRKDECLPYRGTAAQIAFSRRLRAGTLRDYFREWVYDGARFRTQRQPYLLYR